VRCRRRARERRLRDREQRVRALRAPAVRAARRVRGIAHALEPARRRELEPDRGVAFVRRALDRVDDHLTVLDRQLDRDLQQAARRVASDSQRAVLPRAPRAGDGPLGRRVADLAAALLELLGRDLQGVREQRVLVAILDHARERAHFRVRQPAVRERGRDRGHLAQCVRGAHLLARGRQRQVAAPCEPRGAIAHAPLLPAHAIVELAHEHEHSIHVHVHLPREAADRGFEVVDGASGGGVVVEGGDVGRPALPIGGHLEARP